MSQVRRWAATMWRSRSSYTEARKHLPDQNAPPAPSLGQPRPCAGWQEQNHRRAHVEATHLGPLGQVQWRMPGLQRQIQPLTRTTWGYLAVPYRAHATHKERPNEHQREWPGTAFKHTDDP